MQRIKISLLPFIIAIFLSDGALSAPSVDWTYDKNENGQESWGDLSPDYAACSIGTAQSPINIAYTTISALPPLAVHYKKTAVRLEHAAEILNWHTRAGNTLKDGGRTYHLTEINLHSPSEHVVLQRFYPVELEFIHRDEENNIFILSVFFEIGESNAALQSLLDQANAPKAAELAINPALLLPDDHHYYAYTGSLTTPPCTEGVEWRLLRTPMQLSQAQLDQLGKLIKRNARLLQPIYMRIIKESR